MFDSRALLHSLALFVRGRICVEQTNTSQIAFGADGSRPEALADAAAVLTMEPKNPHALQAPY